MHAPAIDDDRRSCSRPAWPSRLSSRSLRGSSLPAPPAAAALRERPDRTWMTDGKVFALARAGNMLILGGRFTELLPPRGSGRGAHRGEQSGRPRHRDGAASAVRTARSRGTDAEVRALAIADGRLYVGGSFSSLGGLGGREHRRHAHRRREPSLLVQPSGSRAGLRAGGHGGPAVRRWRFRSGRRRPASEARSVGHAVRRPVEELAPPDHVRSSARSRARCLRDLGLHRRRLRRHGAGRQPTSSAEPWRRWTPATAACTTGGPTGVIGDPQTAWAVDVDAPARARRVRPRRELRGIVPGRGDGRRPRLAIRRDGKRADGRALGSTAPASTWAVTSV